MSLSQNRREELKRQYNEWFGRTRSPIGEGFTANSDQISDFWLTLLDKELEKYKEEKVAELTKMKRIRKPTHGICCTCQVCGGNNDYECDCPRNKVIDEALSIFNPKQ